MKYVYVIISEEHDPELDYIHQYSMPIFAFTSIKKAKDQMLKLKELIDIENDNNSCCNFNHFLGLFLKFV